MYRIRSGSGAEAVYNSLEEFNVAVRRGAVSPDDEIFHMRANRWLDVKSHPHYRLAIGGAGHSESPAAASARPPASASAPTPSRPLAAPASAPQAHAPSPAGERPPVRPLQTVLRPQLVAQPVVPPSSAPGQAQRGKDLSFIDLGGSAPASQRNATIIEARKAPAPAQFHAKTEAKSLPSTTEVEFLVMDGGIESPVRTSAGHRTIPPEDLDLLFDAPIHPVKAPSGPVVVASPASPKAQAPSAPAVPAAPRAPATKIEKPVMAASVIAAPKVDAPALAAPVVKAPKVEPPAAVARTIAAPKHDLVPVPAAPQPEAPRTEAVIARAAVRDAEPAPVAPASAPATQPKPVVASKPVVEEDLTIPGAALLEAPSLAVPPDAVVAHAVPAPSSRSIGMLATTGVTLLVVMGGLLMWKPWSARTAGSTGTVPPAPSYAPAAPAPAVPGAPAGAAPSKPGTPVVAPVVQAPKPPEAAAKTDSSTAKPTDDEVIAAARPNFRADVDVPSGDLGLPNDIRSVAVPSTVVAPSELTSRLEAAERLAQLELGTKLGGFRSLLAPNRLTTLDGIVTTRTAWSTSAEVIRQYRAKIARMEKAYEDSVLTSQRAQRWSSEEMRAWAAHQSQAEPVETSQLADLMFSQVSEGLDLLAALDGQYEVKGGLIVFKNPASGTRYTSIRTWVEQRMQVWSSTPESARVYSISAILRALGDGFPATP